MSANDELRAHLLVIYEHARDALGLIDDGASVPSSLIAPSGTCTHPEDKRTRMMGGHWMCDPLKGGCGVKGQDT